MRSVKKAFWFSGTSSPECPGNKSYITVKNKSVKVHLSCPSVSQAATIQGEVCSCVASSSVFLLTALQLI